MVSTKGGFLVYNIKSPAGQIQYLARVEVKDFKYRYTFTNFVQFVVDKDGSITDVKAVKGIGAGCDEEAVRVIKTSPKWSPGKQRGRAVKVRMILPITFKLG